MNVFDIIIKLYDQLIITEAVHQEAIVNGKKKGKQEAIIGEKLIKEDKIKVHVIDEELMDLKLGKGETEIIHNSINNKCSCVIEDKKAKKIAEKFDLDVKTIPISLLEAYKKRILNNSDFDFYLIRWVKHANPSYDEVYFIKKMKELLD